MITKINPVNPSLKAITKISCRLMAIPQKMPGVLNVFCCIAKRHAKNLGNLFSLCEIFTGNKLVKYVKSFYLSSSYRRCSARKGVLRNFAKFTGKHLCQSVFFNKVASLRPESLFLQNCRPQACNFIKNDTLAQVFSCENCEISKNTFFTEHLWATASVYL